MKLKEVHISELVRVTKCWNYRLLVSNNTKLKKKVNISELANIPSCQHC
jgi:hypothetical protein